MKAILAFRQRFAFCLLGGLAACGFGASAYGQAMLTFTGGSGAPITFTLSQPVTYTVTAAATNSPLFIFQGTGNVFNNGFSSLTGSITYQINSGAPVTLNTVRSGINAGSISASDVYTYGNGLSLAVGDVVTITSGTETTTSNFAGAVTSTGGSFTTFLGDGNTGSRISGNGAVAAPEPSTWAMLILGGVGLLGVTLRRRVARV